MKCLNCGFECADGGAFCNNCGSKLTAPVQPQQAPQQPQQQPPQQPQYQPPQQPQQQVPQQSQQQVPAAEKKKVNLPVLIILLIVGLLIIGGGAYVILDGFDIIDEPDLFSFVDSDDDKDDDDKDKDSEDGSTKDADENEEATTAASDAEKPKPVETTVATETTTRYEIVTEAIATEAVATEAVATEAVATEAVATDAVSRPDSGAYDDYDWEADVDRCLTLLWEMAELAYEYMDVPDEDLPQDVQDRFIAIEDEMEELEYRIDSFMEVCDDEIYNEIMEMMNDEFADMAEKYPEIFE